MGELEVFMNMKKIIRLTESELLSLVNKVIVESKRFKNQEMIDDILDKISSQGIDSLTDFEREMLDNPDVEIMSTPTPVRDEVDDSNHPDLKCLQRYVEHMFDESDMRKNKYGELKFDYRTGGLGLWNNNDLPDSDDDDAFDRFLDVLKKIVDRKFFGDEGCSDFNLDSVDYYTYEYYVNELMRRKGEDDADLQF